MYVCGGDDSHGSGARAEWLVRALAPLTGERPLSGYVRLPRLQRLLRYAGQVPGCRPIPQPPQANQVLAIFTKYIDLAVSGDQPVQTAMDNMQKDLTDALSRSA